MANLKAKAAQRRRKRARAKLEQDQLQETRPKHKIVSVAKRFFVSSWKVLGILALLIGLVASLLTFTTRLTVSAPAPLDLSNPFSTPFEISNDGYFAINNVKIACVLMNLETSDHYQFQGFGVRNSTQHIGTIEATEKAAERCVYPFIGGGKVTNADILITVTFSPSLVPIEKTSMLRFVTMMDSTGQLRWGPQPLTRK